MINDYISRQEALDLIAGYQGGEVTKVVARELIMQCKSAVLPSQVLATINVDPDNIEKLKEELVDKLIKKGK